MQPFAALIFARRFQAASVVLVAAACLWSSQEAAVAAILGGALMALHITLMLIVARYCMAQQSEGRVAAAAMLFLVKFGVMAALIALTIMVLRPHAAGFVAGMATFIPGMVGAVIGHRSRSTQDALCTPRF